MIESEHEFNRGCLCLYIKPCHIDCTCLHRFSSAGCRRCCSFGSAEQRQSMAESFHTTTFDAVVPSGYVEITARIVSRVVTRREPQ